MEICSQGMSARQPANGDSLAAGFPVEIVGRCGRGGEWGWGGGGEGSAGRACGGRSGPALEDPGVRESKRSGL